LHCEDGPAVAWPNGTRYWFVRGVQVPQRVVESPEKLTAAEVYSEANLEVRRVMLDRFGADRYIRDIGANQIHSDECGTLWWAPVGNDEPLVMVEVLNSTPEPDGSIKTYWLRVPPNIRTARGAVAWTFGEDSRSYKPMVQT